jgi:uncharacterized protein YggE
VAQDLQSEPKYERDEADQNKRGQLIGYVVTRSFKVNVRDLTKYGKLGDQIMALGGIRLGYISGELSDREKLGEELWPKAIANAREQAEKTLKPMGMKIDSVFAVSSIDFGVHFSFPSSIPLFSFFVSRTLGHRPKENAFRDLVFQPKIRRA